MEIPGLHLPSMTVTRISGPVSMYYLKPSLSVYETFHSQGIDLPLILLFGDAHRSEEGRCKDCDQDSSCRLIQDPDFLKEFDEIARETPVDFYTESAPTKEGYHKKGKNILFTDFIHRTVASCHITTNRKSPSYITQCPTKFIRWHYGDIRAFPSVIEGFMLFPLTLYINMVIEAPYRTKYDSMIYTFIQNNRHIRDYSLYKKAEPYNVTFLTSIRVPLSDAPMSKEDSNLLNSLQVSIRAPHDILEYKDAITNPEFLEVVDSVRQKYSEFMTQEMSTQWMNKIAYNILKILRLRHKLSKSHYIRMYLLAVQRVIVLIDEYLTEIQKPTNKSGILKQLQKIHVPFLNDLGVWRGLMIESAIGRYELIESIIELDLYQRKHPQLFNTLYDKIIVCISDPPDDMTPYSLKEYERNNDNATHTERTLRTLHYLIQYFNSNMTDLYTLTRILKTPERIQPNGAIQKETQASLVLGFFGNAHIRKIVDTLLLPPFSYDLRYQNDDTVKEGKRCIQLSDAQIPLTEDVTQHHDIRFNTNQYEKSNEYYRRLREEQRARMRTRNHKKSPSLKKSLVKTMKRTTSIKNV